MGINKESLNFINRSIAKYSTITKYKMVELGNQHLKGIGGSAKQYFLDRGMDHISIDINGEDGALKINLQKEIKDQSFIEAFDVITNFGTTEHVKQQYICWLNIHNLVKQNGLFIHLLPRTKHWSGHGFHKYNLDFFTKLSNSCNYELLENFIRKDQKNRDLIGCVIRKRKESKFISKNTFKELGITRK